MVRFWRVRIRFIFATWLSLHIYSGSFTAPAWLMLGLWLVRELVFGSYFEPHAMVSGGVATWAHIFGFGALAALAIRASRIEERWIRPKVIAATGELHNAILDQASDLLQRERYDEAWELLRKELAAQPKNGDAVILWWDLASRLGRQLEVAPHLLRKIRHDLQKGEFDVAWQWPGRVRILLDTNIIVSGFLSLKGPPGRLVRGWLLGRFELVTSQEQIAELARVVSYEHLRSRIDRMQAQAFIENIDSQAIVATDLPTLTHSPDPSDNVILATGVAGEAEAVVSGDKADILNLCEVEGIPIMTARDVLEHLGMVED